MPLTKTEGLSKMATDSHKIIDTLENILVSTKKYQVEGGVNKNLVAADARRYDEALIELLAADSSLKKHFFSETKYGLVFKKDIFLQFIMNKEFLPDSYTKYKIKIGLGAEDGSLLSESGHVVLNWPYKDAILEGGQDKEDQKRSEVFFNEVLAPDQITRLLDDKVFTNWKRYDEDGEHELDELRYDDNLIIKGNNLVVLHSLKKRYAGKVKLIYIDPPYNTGNDGFGYNDSFNHSTWLTFMRNRLEVARELLTEDGSIYIQLDYNEVHYCKVLMDEIFGADCFQREIIWSNETSSGYKAQAKNWIRGHDSILFYSKSRNFHFSKLYRPLDARTEKRYDKVDENGRKYKLYLDSGKERRVYLDSSKGRPMSDVWSDLIGFQTVNRGGETLGFDGQKTEALLERVIRSATLEGDLVLDYHLGSGTTAAVAHKMGRRYIGVEQMTYIETIAIERLNKVISGDQSGISKSIDWQGGGSFVYANIVNSSNKFRKRVEAAKNESDYLTLLNEATSSSFLSYRVDPKKLNQDEFHKLSAADKRRLLLELIDNNTLYVNYEDINDPIFRVSEKDKKLNATFYGVSEKEL